MNLPVGTGKLVTIRGKVECVMADKMELGLETDRRDLLPGNALLLNGTRYLIHKRNPLTPAIGQRVWLWLVKDNRNRKQRRRRTK
jgi:hypothetical protein